MRFTFEPLRRTDLELMARWRSTPHVVRWWPGPHDLASIAQEYEPLVDGSDTTRAFVCSADGRPIGYAQAYRLADEPAWQATIAEAIGVVHAAGIDYFIGEPESVGQGIGSKMIADFVVTVWQTFADVSSVVVAVQQENAASWKALERAGFDRVWAGHLDSDDPSDQGPAYVYVLARPLE
jgi:aminoglycoside 6'-N-acetyltransferase